MNQASVETTLLIYSFLGVYESSIATGVAILDRSGIKNKPRDFDGRRTKRGSTEFYSSA